jgi:hypothetical protein
MNIGEAVQAMLKGDCVRRAGWNGKGMHIYIEDGHTETIPGGVFKGEKREYAPHMVLFNAQGVHQPGWNASTPDLLATDWEIVPYDELK